MTDDANPRIFGKYEVIRRVAVGGMGEIFLARQVGMAGFDRLAILKSLLPQLAAEPDMLSQFLDEARIVAHVNHPNVVGIFEVGEWEGVYFIAMEYINGVDVATLLRTLDQQKGHMPIPVVASIVRDAAMGLGAAHDANDAAGNPLKIVHRDISPQNIMVRAPDGLGKVVDFGVALSENRSTKTEVGMLKGKLGYMPPEQIRGEGVDGRSDQWGLGVCLWEMSTGRRLFAGDNPATVFMRILQEPIPWPSQVRADVPRELDAVVMRMLAREPSSRFPRMEEVATALRRLLDAIPKSEGAAGRFVKDIAGEKIAERVRDLTPAAVSIPGLGQGAPGVICAACGNRAVKSDRFCRSCGTPLGSGSGPVSPSPGIAVAAPGFTEASGPMRAAPGFARPGTGAHPVSPPGAARPGSAGFAIPKTEAQSPLPPPAVKHGAVAVLACRIVGEQLPQNTRLSRSPEEILRILLAELTEVALKHQGQLVPGTPGSFAVGFGADRVTGDEASRAVWCAQELIAATEAVGTAVRRGLTLKVGLSGGKADLGAPRADLAGLVKDRADALVIHAAKATILVDEGTQRLTDSRLRYRRKFQTLADPHGEALVASEYDAGVAPQSVYGRAFEIGIVQSALDSVLHDQPVQVLLSGERGIGRTIMLDVADRIARERGFAVGRASGARVGVGATFEVARQLVRSLALDAAAALGVQRVGSERVPWNEALPMLDMTAYDQRRLRAFVGDVSPDDGVHPSRRRMLTRAAVHAFFVAIAKKVGACLIVDDADRADPASLQLLADIFGRMEKARLGLFAAAAATTTQRIMPGARKVELIGLSPQAMDQLASKLLEGMPLSPEARGAMFQRVQGNPLHLVLLVEQLKAQGALVRQHDSWTLQTSEYVRGNPGTDVLFHARHARLTPQAIHMLNAGAMIGLSPPRNLIEACGQPGRDPLDALYELFDAGVFLDVDDSMVTWAFASEYDAVRTRMDAADQRSVHLRIADAIERTPQPQTLEFFERVGGHYVGADLKQKAVPYFEKAADRLAILGGAEAAADLYKRVLQVEWKVLTADASEQRVGRAFSLASRASAALVEVDPNAAAEISMPLFQTFAANVAAHARAEAMQHRGHALLVGKRFDEAAAALQEAMTGLGAVEDPRLSANIMDDLAILMDRNGDTPGAINALLEAFRGLGKIPAEQRAAWEKLMHLARLYMKARQNDRAREAYTFALDDAKRGKNLSGEAEVLAAIAALTAMTGNPEKASEELAQATEKAEEAGDLFLSARLAMQNGRLLAQLNRVQDAGPLLHASLEICERIGWDEGAAQARQALSAIGA